VIVCLVCDRYAMPSQEMQGLIDGFRDQQKASAGQAPPPLEEWRAAFAPAGRLHPVPDVVLLSDSERLAAAAAEAGVDVTLEVGEGLPHVYPILLGTPEAAEATERIGKFLRARVR
jgi:acetyl esterase/lipase